MIWLFILCTGPHALAESAPPDSPKETDACSADQACSEHDDQATRFFRDQKDYSKALVEFQRAFAAVPEPRLLLNIGRCFFRLGKAEEAIRYYESYQREVPRPPPEPAALLPRYLAEARSVLAAQHAVAPPMPPPLVATPLYRRWSFWTVSGLVVSAAAVAIGLGVGLSQPPSFSPTERIY